MPIYDYQCTSCGHELEVIQKVSDAPLTVCPDCSEAGLQKKVSAPSFRLSGKGWYETDFKDNNQKNIAKRDEKPVAKKEAKAVSSCCSGSCGCS